MLYVGDGCIEVHNLIWAHTMLTEVARMFEIVGIHINLGKTKVMVCNPGFIWGELRVRSINGDLKARRPCSGSGRKPG